MSHAQTGIAELLAKTEIFRTLSPTECVTVAARMRTVSFDDGQSIFSRGDDARELYLVESGRVRLSILSAEGRELSLTHATAGQVFGEIAVLDGGKRTADATALAKVKALSLTRAALVELMERSPVIAIGAIAFLCRRLRETDQTIEAIALHPIEVRLARFLLSAVRLQSVGLAPVAAKASKMTVLLDMSQTELALLIGASRPKVNAALAGLEDTGAIARDGGRIVCDIAELTAIAQSD